MTLLVLDTQIRDALVQRICASLENAAPMSSVQLRGSLAGGTADAYSDIDLLWEIPDEVFLAAVDCIGGTLSQAQPVESLRSDRDFQNSDKRRLFYVQFVDMPLFWRADIEVFARSLQGDAQYDVGNAAARGNDWSLTHSALMNAIAAVKALLRGREDTAQQLLVRGFERVGLAPPDGDPQGLIPQLVEGVVAVDAALAVLGDRILELHRQVFGPGNNG